MDIILHKRLSPNQKTMTIRRDQPVVGLLQYKLACLCRPSYEGVCFDWKGRIYKWKAEYKLCFAKADNVK